MRIATASLIILLILSPVFSENMEKSKITMLLDAIETSGLTFVRNGSEYPARKARMHLEYKLSKAGVMIKTARQFITHIATKSSWSGKYYYIQYPDGRKIRSGLWLLARLKEIEKKSK